MCLLVLSRAIAPSVKVHMTGRVGEMIAGDEMLCYGVIMMMVLQAVINLLLMTVVAVVVVLLIGITLTRIWKHAVCLSPFSLPWRVSVLA